MIIYFGMKYCVYISSKTDEFYSLGSMFDNGDYDYLFSVCLYDFKILLMVRIHNNLLPSYRQEQ